MPQSKAVKDAVAKVENAIFNNAQGLTLEYYGEFLEELHSSIESKLDAWADEMEVLEAKEEEEEDE